MDTSSRTLRKMIALGREEAAPLTIQAAKCANLAIAKVARRLFDVDAILEGATLEESSQQEMLKSAPVPGLLAVVGTVDGRRGVLCFDGLLINAIVEIMTGAADGAVFREARGPTLIDAALCREFSESFLDHLVREVNSAAGQEVLSTISYIQHETESEKLVFELEDVPHSCLRGNVKLQGGLRGGALLLALPTAMWDGDAKKNIPTENESFTRNLEKNVLESSLVLRADLDSFSLSLSRALELKPGDTLAVSALALSDISMVSESGISLLRGRLGQIHGKKAIMICGDEPETETLEGGMRVALASEEPELGIGGSTMLL